MLTSAGLWVEDGIRPFLESFQPGSATGDYGPRWRVLPAGRSVGPAVVSLWLRSPKDRGLSEPSPMEELEPAGWAGSSWAVLRALRWGQVTGRSLCQ